LPFVQVGKEAEHASTIERFLRVHMDLTLCQLDAALESENEGRVGALTVCCEAELIATPTKPRMVNTIAIANPLPPLPL